MDAKESSDDTNHGSKENQLGGNMSKDLLIEKLIAKNIFKLEDGRDLYEGDSEELARLLRDKKETKQDELS